MRFLSLLLFVSVLAAASPIRAEDAARAANRPLRVLLTYGGHGFEEKPFFALFDALPGVQYTKAPLPESADRLKPGLEKDFDVLVMYDMFSGFTPEQRQAFVELLKAGLGVVSLHHNVGAHGNWDEFRKIIGGKFIFADCEIDGRKYTPSPWAHGQDLKVHVVDKEHPITRGLPDFEIHDETYGRFYVAPDNHVLLTTDHPQNNPEVAWTREYGKSRVFHLMLGHDHEAWSNPNYPQLLGRGIEWAARRR
jgi:type 1 glutamine amidotransferase